MSSIQVSGGKRLCGETVIQGSKNAALPLMAAAVLHKGMTVLHNCPEIQDVECMRALLEDLGCRTGREVHTLWIDASELKKNELDADLTSKMRGSVLLMGAVLGRCGEVILPFPGGCVIGKRPVNYHLDIMQRMGTEVVCKEDRMILRAGTLSGTTFRMPFPSVGATENGILAGTLASGTTCFGACAMEPEIQELCFFLQEKGAKVRIEKDGIRINGVKELQDSEYTLMPDRIVAGTYLLAVLGCGGSATLHHVPMDALNALTEQMTYLGGEIRVYQKENSSGKKNADTIVLNAAHRKYPALRVKTAPYPGFPTDLQSQLMAVMASWEGSTCEIQETVFENRFMIAEQLKKMGADIRICKNKALVKGVSRLKGTDLEAQELRGGAALILAALAADGISRISPECYIKRGYENICKDLKELGADIQFVMEKESGNFL